MNTEDIEECIKGLKSKEIFFITGCIKSGTTWVELICNNHPEISCFGEAHIFPTFKERILKAVEDQNMLIQKKTLKYLMELKV